MGGASASGGVGGGLREITQEQRDEIDEAFNIFDTNHTGELDFHELKVAMRALGFDVPKQEVLEILQQYDRKNGRRIRREDFTKVMTHRIQARDPEEEVRRAFRLFAGDKETIRLEDLTRVSGELQENISEEELRAMIDEFDMDNTGEITFEEFRNIMFE